MKFSLNWLKDYLDIDAPLETLVRDITMSAFEIEEIEEKGAGLDQIVIGKVLKLEAHPNADKLRVATVKLGSFKKNQIVCGAPNIAVDQLVPVILPGSTLPGEGGFTIEEKELRGVLSQGMICSEQELGLSANHEGIMVLPEDAKIGQSLADYLGYRDTVLDIKVTANRNDAFSHIGIARELAAIFKTPLNLPALELADLDSATLTGVGLTTTVETPKLATVYETLVVSHVQVTESPQWIKNRLTACGLRPINNIVDAANYVMLELGQPMHTFDYAKISHSDITVRNATEGEKITTLDGEEHTLTKQMLVIADRKGAVAIAGVIGGLESAVTDDTKTLVVEAAVFDRVSIRKTSRHLGLRTQASGLFERGVNARLPHQAFVRFLTILQETCPELLYGNLIKKGIAPEKPQVVELSVERVNKFLGLQLTQEKIAEILTSLGFEIATEQSPHLAARKEGLLSVTVPYYRMDISMDQDLIEEVGRIYGYQHITPVLPRVITQIPAKNRLDATEDDIRDALVSRGFSEITTKSFIGDWQIKHLTLDPATHIEILNPISPDQRYMRTSLAQTVLPAIELNAKQFEHFKLFEVGRTFHLPSKQERLQTPAIETHQLALAVVHQHDEVVMQIKASCDALFHLLRVPQEKIVYKKTAVDLLHPGKSAAIMIDNQQVGMIGELHPALRDKLSLHSRVAIAEFNIDALMTYTERQPAYKAISKYPFSLQDLSVIVESHVASRDVSDTIKEFGKKLITDLELVEVYEDEKLGRGKKSLLFRIRYQALDHTLKDEEVKRMHERIMDALKSRHHAVIRA